MIRTVSGRWVDRPRGCVVEWTLTASVDETQPRPEAVPDGEVVVAAPPLALTGTAVGLGRGVAAWRLGFVRELTRWDWTLRFDGNLVRTHRIFPTLPTGIGVPPRSIRLAPPDTPLPFDGAPGVPLVDGAARTVTTTHTSEFRGPTTLADLGGLRSGRGSAAASAWLALSRPGELVVLGRVDWSHTADVRASSGLPVLVSPERLLTLVRAAVVLQRPASSEANIVALPRCVRAVTSDQFGYVEVHRTGQLVARLPGPGALPVAELAPTYNGAIDHWGLAPEVVGVAPNVDVGLVGASVFADVVAAAVARPPAGR